jgi:hypothetical protein
MELCSVAYCGFMTWCLVRRTQILDLWFKLHKLVFHDSEGVVRPERSSTLYWMQVNGQIWAAVGLPPSELDPSTRQTEDWVGPMTSADAGRKIKISACAVPLTERRQSDAGYSLTPCVAHTFLCNKQFAISGFRRDTDEICALLGYYTASCGNSLPTFRDNVSVPCHRGSRNPRRPLKMGPIRRFITSVKDYHPMPRNMPEERRSQLQLLTNIVSSSGVSFGRYRVERKFRGNFWRRMSAFQTHQIV